ncbi:MAG: pilus assembly protein [Anaerolineales bacterium]|jgi:Flp pilus assembly protein TadG
MKHFPRSKSSAQGLVEFAIILPIFLLVLFVIFDLGRLTFYYSALHNAAREGARYGIVNENDIPGVINAVNNLTVGMDISFPPSTVTFNTDTVVVTLFYDFQAASPFLNILIGTNTFTLSSSATMQGEW